MGCLKIRTDKANNNKDTINKITKDNVLNDLIYDIIDHFVSIIKPFCNLPQSFHDNLMTIFDNIEIEFSDEPKKSPYKKSKYSTEKLKKILLQKWPRIEDWANIDRCTSRKELESVFKEIVDNIADAYGSTRDEVQNFFDAIFNEIGDAEYVCLGEYNDGDIDGEKKIIIYLDNIISSNYDLASHFFDVFAHEAFHAIHYWLFTSNILNDNPTFILDAGMTKCNDYTANVVFESLATYFELSFDKIWQNEDLKIITDNLRYNLNDDTVINYPYCGALEIRDNEHFYNVLKLSLSNMDCALRELLSSSMDDYYAIKNKK